MQRVLTERAVLAFIHSTSLRIPPISVRYVILTLPGGDTPPSP